MRYGIVTDNLEEYADPRVAVRLAHAAQGVQTPLGAGARGALLTKEGFR